MKLTSKFKTESVTLDDRIIVLRELTAGELNEYRMGLVSIDKDGNTTINAKDANARLVFLCSSGDDKEQAFESIEVISKLPGRTVEAMFKVCSELNALDKEAEVRAGKA